MMSCKDLAALLIKFRDGDLDEAGAAQLQAHLGMCPPCNDLMDGYNEVVRLLRGMGPGCLPSDALARIRERLAAEDDA